MNLSTKCLCAASLALLFGCANNNGNRASGPGSVSSLQFDDMAVPDGMTLLTDIAKSHSYSSGEYRKGDFEYYGGVSVVDAVSYTCDRMKLDRWSLRSEKAETLDIAELIFSKTPYTTTYKIWKDGSVTRMTVQYRTNQ